MQHSQSLYIGLDIGTSGVRACAINAEKQILQTSTAVLPAPIQQQQSITQDAQLWWQAADKVLTELSRRIEASRVLAIAVNGTSGTVLVSDEQGKPLAPARMYNDTHCSEQASIVTAIAPVTCAAHGSSSGLAKLLFLYQQVPHASHLLHQADWVSGQLSGRFDISDENNALKTGYDPQLGQWPDWLTQLLEQLQVPISLLPEVAPPGTVTGNINAETVKKYGFNPQCQVVSGTTDSIAAFIATGTSQPGDAVTSLGSTLVLKVLCEKPVYAAEYGIYSHKLGNYWLAGGASNTGGAVLKQYFSDQQLQQLSAQMNPQQPTGLDYYPLTGQGERFPINDPNLAPRLEPRPASDVKFLQAMLEGMSRIEQLGYQRLHQLGAPLPTQVETAGGGSVNTAWTSIREQLLGVPVKQAVFSEACYGSALLAMSGYRQQQTK